MNLFAVFICFGWVLLFAVCPCCGDAEYIKSLRKASTYIYIRENSIEWNDPGILFFTHIVCYNLFLHCCLFAVTLPRWHHSGCPHCGCITRSQLVQYTLILNCNNHSLFFFFSFFFLQVLSPLEFHHIGALM